MRKIEKFIFYLLIVCIPISLRHIFNYAPVGFMEWKAISIYGTDILFAALLIFAFKNKFKIKINKTDCWLVALVAISLISAIRAFDARIAIFQTLKLTEFIILYLYVRDYVFKNFEREKIYFSFIAGGLIQAVFSILQYTLQRSLGLKYFGESIFNPAMTGVAAFMSHGEKIVRAYGTTPHPNVLAAYLLIALASFWLIFPIYKKHIILRVIYVILLWGLLVTFSRTVIAIGSLFFLIWTIKEYKKYKVIILISVIIGAIFLASHWPEVTNRIEISSSDEAVSLRVFYNNAAISHGITWLGVGAGNFVPWLIDQLKGLGLPADQYQPVHNIYLLIYREVGLLGLLTFVAWLFSLIKSQVKHLDREKIIWFGLFCVFLLLGLFDHFLWTIQPGQLLFWLMAGVISSKNV